MQIRLAVLNLFLLITLLFSSCIANVEYSFESEKAGEKHNGRMHYFLFGNAGTGELDIKKLCPEKVYQFKIYRNNFDRLAGLFTFPIYSSQSYEVVCERKYKGDQK